jgi:hypothetical protein
VDGQALGRRLPLAHLAEHRAVGEAQAVGTSWSERYSFTLLAGGRTTGGPGRLDATG